MPGMDTTPRKIELLNTRPPGGYKARAPREQTYLNGKLVHHDGAFTHDCTVRDISEGGARIVLAARELLPADLYLIVAHRSVAYRARIVWLDYPARGLQFVEKHVLEEELPAEPKFLRQLWGGLITRAGTVVEERPRDSAQTEMLGGSTF